MTREEWLRHLVEKLDVIVFGGDLDLLNHPFQIGCGRVMGSRATESIQPYDGPDVTLDDFFPTTIGVNFTIKDPFEMACALCYECIKAFFNIKKCDKQFKMLAEKYYFEKPYKEIHPSAYLEDMIKLALKEMNESYGPFPGEPVKIHKKDKKDGKKNTLEIFCPNCGYSLKISRKVYDTYNGGLPTCCCGTKMGVDLSDEEPKEPEK